MAPVGRCQGLPAPGIDDVHDAFRFRQVQTAVQEGPFGEFPRFRRPRPGLEGQSQDFLEGFPAPVALDLTNIFSRIGMGSRHVHRQHLIHHLAFPVQDMAVQQLPGIFPSRLFPPGKEPADNGKAVRSADPDHPNGTHAHSSGNGTDCIIHHSFPPKEKEGLLQRNSPVNGQLSTVNCRRKPAQLALNIVKTT